MPTIGKKQSKSNIHILQNTDYVLMNYLGQLKPKIYMFYYTEKNQFHPS